MTAVIDMSLLERGIAELITARGGDPLPVSDESELETVRAAYKLSPSATVMFVRRRLARAAVRLRDTTPEATGDPVRDAQIALGAAAELRRLQTAEPAA